MDHPNRIFVSEYKEQFIYCINTTSKVIEINNLFFTDWDEIYGNTIDNLMDKTTSDIHTYYDKGFIPSTILFLKNGSIREIKDIEVGDILEDKIKVTGIVKINGLNLHNDYLECLDENKKLRRYTEVYHLITDCKYFFVNNNKHHHYNYCIEEYL